MSKFGVEPGDVLKALGLRDTPEGHNRLASPPGAGNGWEELAASIERAEDVAMAYMPPAYRRRLAEVKTAGSFRLARAVIGIAAFSLANGVFGDGDPAWSGARGKFDAALSYLRDVRDGKTRVPALEREGDADESGS